MKIFFDRIIYLLLLSILGSCSYFIDKEINSSPHWKPKTVPAQFKEVTIALMSNLNGKVDSEPTIFHNTTIPISKGGVKLQQKYLEILKRKYSDQVLLFHTGNFLSKDFSSENILKFKNLSFDAISFNEEELYQKNKFEENPFPFINSNIIDLQDQNLIQGNKILPFRIFQTNRLNIGVISITSFESFKEKDFSKIRGLYIQDAISSILIQKKALKEQGVQIIVLMANLDGSCASEKHNTIIEGEDRKDFSLDCSLSKNHLGEIIKRLPPDAIDLVLSSSNNNDAGFIGNIPVVQVKGDGKYLRIINLNYNEINKKIDQDLTQISSPIIICDKFFQEFNDCYQREDMTIKNISLIPALFLGEHIN